MNILFAHLEAVIGESKTCLAQVHQAADARFRGSQAQRTKANWLHLSLVTQFNTLWRRLIPAKLATALEQAKKGNDAGLDLLVSFLEWDPYFFRSGYVKAEILRTLKRRNISPYSSRLQRYVLKKVDQGASQEFKEIRRLALCLPQESLIIELQQRNLAGQSSTVRWRAKSILQAMASLRSEHPRGTHI